MPEKEEGKKMRFDRETQCDTQNRHVSRSLARVREALSKTATQQMDLFYITSKQWCYIVETAPQLAETVSESQIESILYLLWYSSGNKPSDLQKMAIIDLGWRITSLLLLGMCSASLIWDEISMRSEHESRRNLFLKQQPLERLLIFLFLSYKLSDVIQVSGRNFFRFEAPLFH